jgi:hypothetical protein
MKPSKHDSSVYVPTLRERLLNAVASDVLKNLDNPLRKRCMCGKD